jgi:pyrimidine deaminase RibD-like protein
MAKERTDKSRYRSPSTGDYCTASQWLAETMCMRIAKKNKEGSLAYKFWNTKKWKSKYGWQVVCANRLIKQFCEETVISYIEENKWILSLGIKSIPKKMIPHHAKTLKIQKLRDEKVKQTKKVEEKKTDGANIKRKKKSIASRLD